MSSGSKAAFYLAIGAFWWDFLEQKPLFWIIFGPWAETLLPSGKTYLAELSKLFSTCPYKQLKEEHDSQNFFISIIFGRWAISFGIWQRSLGSIVKTTFYTSIEKLRGEKFCWQTVFFFFGPQAKNSRPPGKIFQQGCRNSIILVHRYKLSWNYVLSKEMHFFIIFGLWAKNFWPAGKNFWWVYQNCILRVHRNTLGRKTTFLKNKNFYQSWTLS